MFSDACRLIILYLHRSIHQGFPSSYSLKATGQLCLSYRKKQQGREALVCLQIEVNEKAGTGYRNFDSSFFCFTQWQNSALVCLSSTAITKLILLLKCFSFSAFLKVYMLLSWAHTVQIGIFEIDCRLLIRKNKQHHQNNKSTGAAEKCSHRSQSELVVTQLEIETHSLLPAALGPISLHLGIKGMPTQQGLSSVHPYWVL